MGPPLEPTAITNSSSANLRLPSESEQRSSSKRRRKSADNDVLPENARNDAGEARDTTTSDGHELEIDDQDVNDYRHNEEERLENIENDRTSEEKQEEEAVDDVEEVENEGQEEEEDENPGDAAAGGKVKIARARSAWMIFLSDNREKVRQENPGLAVGPMQKILSEMWKGLSVEESARYAKLAVEDKARMQKELADAGLTKLPAKKSSPTSAEGGVTDLVLPLARVRKTVRLDPGVGNISKEGLQLVAKATEIFMEVMAERAWKIGRQTGRKSVRPCDLADSIFAAPEMYWLRDEFRDERSSVKQSARKSDGAAKAPARGKGAQPVAKGAKAITSFFQKA